MEKVVIAKEWGGHVRFLAAGYFVDDPAEALVFERLAAEKLIAEKSAPGGWLVNADVFLLD
jgi:hypothetical protein